MINNNTQCPVYTVIKNISSRDVSLRGIGPIRSAIIKPGKCISYPGSLFDQIMPRQLNQLLGALLAGSLLYTLLVRSSKDEYTAIRIAPKNARMTDDAAAALVGVTLPLATQITSSLLPPKAVNTVSSDNHIVVASKSSKLMLSMGAVPSVEQPFSHSRLNQDNSLHMGFTKAADSANVFTGSITELAQVNLYALLLKQINELYAQNDYTLILALLKASTLHTTLGTAPKFTKKAILNATSFAELVLQLSIQL